MSAKSDLSGLTYGELKAVPTSPVPYGDAFPKVSNQAVRVALVDDEESIHQLMGRMLMSIEPAWLLECYLEANQALEQIPCSRPDVVIMDIAMPGLDGIECTKKLKAVRPDLPVLMLSGHVNPEILFRCMMAGASGCLHKPASAREIVQALKKALGGALILCPQSEKNLLECFQNLGKNLDSWGLSRRESEIMNCICQQRTDKQIARMLGIAENTVHAHLAGIFKKMAVHSRSEAVRKIMHPGRLTPESRLAR